MQIRNKSGQFFIIAIVLIYLAIISIFFYVRSSEETSVNFFIEDRSLDMENIINAIHQRNNWMQGSTIYAHWFLDPSFEKRKLVSVTCNDGLHSNPSLIKYPLNIWPNDTRNCSKEVRVVSVQNTGGVGNAGGDVQSSVNSSVPPCTVYWNITCGSPLPHTQHFYLYWDNKYTEAPPPADYSRHIIDLSGVGVIGSKTIEAYNVETSPAIKLCNHFETIYPEMGLWINCTTTFNIDPYDLTAADISYYNDSGNISVVQLEVRSPNFYFNGSIT
ncbi:MAG: hypothetical protein AABW84_02375 [Nanoarchaeota archaeon]